MELWWIGEMKTVEIENDQLRVVVAPAYGARVTSLLDKSTGREWMAPGGFSPNTGEDAVYLAAEAVGWDECFPTVAPWDARHTAWGRTLRDHGEIWGRTCDLLSNSATAVSTRYADRQFSFERSLRLNGPRLIADYSLANVDNVPLQYLWALHALLAVTEGDRIEIGTVDIAAATYLSRDGNSFSTPSLNWPGPNLVWPEMLNQVQPASSKRAVKLYASGVRGGRAAIGQGTQWLRIDWDESIDDLGIWLNFGGWPVPGKMHHVALEPTSAPVDHLGQALQRPNPATIEAGESRTWTVTFSVGANNQPAKHQS